MADAAPCRFYFLFFRRRTISPAIINTTRPMPMMTLALMLAYLLLFSEGKESRRTCTDCRDTGKCCPKRHIGGISGLGDIRNRLELVMELGNDRLSFVNGYGDICGKLILCNGSAAHPESNTASRSAHNMRFFFMG